MDVGIPVEVEGKYGEFYHGIVTDLNSIEELAVNILDSSRTHVIATAVVPPSALRLPVEISKFPFDPTSGKEVDVLMPCVAPSEAGTECLNGSSPLSKLSAWWPGKIKRVSGGFVIVELTAEFPDESSTTVEDSTFSVLPNGRVYVPLAQSVEKTDIVEKHQLRPRSRQCNLSSSSFLIHTIDIPDKLISYCRDAANYQHFAKRCGLPVLVCMAPESFHAASVVDRNDGETYEMKARLLVMSTDQSTIQRAAVIDGTFIDMLRQKVLILQKTEELSRKLEASRVVQQPPAFVSDLYVPEEFLPYAIGFQGSNIRQANAIDGILSIKLDRHSCTFRISGKTQKAVEQAKSMLDYTTEVTCVPRAHVGFIVGSGQRHIQHIVDRVGLSGLKVCNAESDAPDLVPFQLTGTKRAISDTKMFLDFHVVSLQELDKLRGIRSSQLTDVNAEKVETAELISSSGDEGAPSTVSTNEQTRSENTHSTCQVESDRSMDIEDNLSREASGRNRMKMPGPSDQQLKENNSKCNQGDLTSTGHLINGNDGPKLSDSGAKKTNESRRVTKGRGSTTGNHSSLDQRRVAPVT